MSGVAALNLWRAPQSGETRSEVALTDVAFRYYFSYPETWKIEVVNKVRQWWADYVAPSVAARKASKRHSCLQVKKGMQGIDAILYEKKGKGEPETPSVETGKTSASGL